MELNKKLMPKWTYLGQVNGTTQINLPNDFTELKIISKINGTTFPYYSFYVLRDELSEEIQLANGYYASNSSNGGIAVLVNTSRVKLSFTYQTGSDKTSQTITKVYYR